MRELLGKKFVRAYRHKKGNYIVLESESGDLVTIKALEGVDPFDSVELKVSHIDAFDDAGFEEIGQF